MFAAGIDGCKNGWVVVWEQNDTTSVQCMQNLHTVLEQKPEIVVIDIPIGLLDCGTRAADICARQFLKHRSCCVFTAPIRPILACKTYDFATQCRRRVEGKSMTKQAWAIVSKIREVDALLTTNLQQSIKEGHPEVTFAVMNGGEPPPSKHSTSGHQARLALLRVQFPEIDLTLEQHKRFREDIIDAYAMLWTARRIKNKEAATFPEEQAIDVRGLNMQIWA